jgi:hypothetical protein
MLRDKQKAARARQAAAPAELQVYGEVRQQLGGLPWSFPFLSRDIRRPAS